MVWLPGQLLELFCCSGNQTHRKGTAPTKNPRFLRSHTLVPSVEARKSSSHRLSLTKHGPRLFCPGAGGRGRADARERRSADATARWSGARARARQARRSACALARPRAWAPARSADRGSCEHERNGRGGVHACAPARSSSACTPAELAAMGNQRTKKETMRLCGWEEERETRDKEGENKKKKKKRDRKIK